MCAQSAIWIIVIVVGAVVSLSLATIEKAKDNGDIYIINEETFIRDHQDQMPTEESGLSSSTRPDIGDAAQSLLINFDEIVALCNTSFSIPMDYYVAFNTTAELPDLVDKTGMCFVRCFFEKSGLLENWKLNEKKIHANIWPAMGDTIEVCEGEGASQANACVRAYAIAKCLTLRALVDAPSKAPT